MAFGLIIKAAIVGAALIAAGVAGLYFKMKDDNIVEEVAEMVIEQQTGIHIDLTPDSPEYDTPPIGKI